MRLHTVFSTPIYFLATLIMLILSPSVNGSDLHKAVFIETSPKWANHNKVDFTVPMPIDEISDGVFYRLIDNQIKVEKSGRREAFSRYVKGVANNKGVEGASQINLDFDPNYQTLHLHAVNIVREGRRIDKLTTSSLSVVNREKELSSLIYNGLITLNVIVDDVRVGDSIEYSFTRKGANPVYKGIFSYSRSINWSVPVQLQFVRVLWGKGSQLNTHIANLDAEIIESDWQGFKQYQLQFNFEQTLKQASQTPNWFDSYATVYFNESADWGDVVNWAEPMYQFTASSNAVEKIATEIKKQHLNTERQIVAALKYVQDEIRYFGIEMGQNSHLPTHPEETLKLKYGDCKDKTVLFLALLEQLDVEAYPALVNTDDTKLLESLPAGVGRFNHVITTLFFDQKQWWFDPTMSNQFGSLSDLYQPNFGFGLVLKPNQSELTAMEGIDQHSKIEITEKFTIAKGNDAEAELAVDTRYSGYEANSILNRFDRDGKLTMAEDYEIYYQGFFASLVASEPLAVTNDELSGIVSINEKYTIPKFWRQGDDSSIDFYPNEIRNAVKKVEEINRTTPFSLTYPDKISHKFIIKFSEGGWDFDNEWTKEDNNYFTFSENVEFIDNVLTLHYEYQAKADHVPAAEITQYIEARDRLRDVAFFGIQKYTEENPESSFINDGNTNSSEEINTSPDENDQGGTDEAKDVINAVSIESSTTENTVEIETEFSRFQLLMIGFLALVSFGIIAWRIESSKRPTFELAEYYPQSISKFAILSLLTFGLYCQYWMYRNWLAIKSKSQPQISPISRALFSVIWLYPLYRYFISDSIKRFGKNQILEKGYVITIFILYIILNMLPFITVSTGVYAAYLLVPLLLLPMVLYINQLNKTQLQAFKYNSQWRVFNSVTLLVFVPAWLYLVGSFTQYLPSDRVVTQDELGYGDLKFLYRKGVLPPSETVSLFYSASLIDIKEDGNGFTDYHVFSYWLENGELVVNSVALSEVKSIDVAYGKNESAETVITINLDSNQSFVLFVPALAGDDRAFVDALNLHWQNNRIIR